MTHEKMIQKIKDRIEYHADKKKYGLFLGSGVIDCLAADILKDLQIAELTARAEKAEAENKELRQEIDTTDAANTALEGALKQAEAELKEAVADIEELLGQEDYLGVCWACAKDCHKGDDCIPIWRGPILKGPKNN